LELETGHPGIIYAYLLSVQDNVLIESPVTAFQANKVMKPGGWFCVSRITRPFFIRYTKKTPEAGPGNAKKGVYATGGCVSTGTREETRPRPRGSFLLKMDEETFRNEFRKSESIYEIPGGKRLMGTFFPGIFRVSHLMLNR
jgi:hypothetical protein